MHHNITQKKPPIIPEAAKYATLLAILGTINSNDQINTATHPKVLMLIYLGLILRYIYTILNFALFPNLACLYRVM